MNLSGEGESYESYRWVAYQHKYETIKFDVVEERSATKDIQIS